jgi:hypothetical protein
MKVAFAFVLVVVSSACGAPPSTPPPAVDTAQVSPAVPEPAPAETGFAPSAPASAAPPPSSLRPAPRTTPGTAPAPGAVTRAVPAAAAASAPDLAPARAAAPTVPAAPVLREVILPRGTVLALELATAVASDSSVVEDSVRAKLVSAVTVDGQTIIPAGADVVGSVTEVGQAGRVRGRARVAFRFSSLRSGAERHDIQTDTIAREAEATMRDDATKVGVGAGVGAVIGGILGGGSGAAKGAAIGGAAGTGAVLATRGQEVRLSAGDAVEARLSAPLTVYVPR